MNNFFKKLLRIPLGLGSGVAAIITILSSHPVLAAALELFPAEFDQKIALVSTDPRVIAARVINAFLMILGVIMVGLVLYGGYTYMTAAGEEEKVTRAKKILGSAGIGLVIILSSMGITRFVLSSILGDVSTGDACTNVGATESCAVGYCSGTRTCSSGGFYGSCIQINASCNSGLESTPRGTFGVVSISPNTTINSKKIVVKVVLSDTPKSETVAGSIVVKNKTTGAVIPGTVYQGAITFARGTANEKVLPLASDTIAFVPQALCPGLEARDLHCFDASTQYSVEVLPSLSRATDSSAVYCGLSGDKCRASFTSGTQVDLTAPTVSVRIDPTSITTTTCTTVQANVSDDGGIGEVEFWHSATNARNVTSANKFGVEGGQGSTSRTIAVQWCPTATTSVDEKHFLYVRAFDNDTGMTESVRTEVTLRPGSCLVAGPGCGAGEGGACTTTADCFNGLTCDAATHTCQAKPRITLVSPGNGKPGTMVTVWGMYFGVTPGRVEFTGPNGTRLAADVPRNCGASFKSWEVDTRTSAATVTVVVPAGAVDGPVYVTTVAGITDASNDTNGVLTPSNTPGPGVPPVGEFDVNDINRPGVCSLSPASGLWDARFTIATVETGSSTGAVIVNDTPTPQISSWSNTSVATSVPRTDYSTPASPAQVSVIAVNGSESNQLPFLVNSPDAGTVPVISSIDPSASGGPSAGITIKGKNFGSAAGVVYFAAPDGQVVKADLSELPDICGGNYWNPTEIRVKVPRVLDKDDWNANGNRSEVLEDKKYKVYVVRYDAVESNRPDFAMTGKAEARPFIWCISPGSGKSFTNVTVYGEQLGGVPAANRGLMFKTLAPGASAQIATIATLTNVGGTPGDPCPNNGWDEHTICAQVPANAVSGKVRVETTCGDVDCVSNDVDFNIGSCADPKTPIACRGNEQCCTDGICRGTGMCQASIPNGFYGWTFTTASTPVSPRVVEDCAENALDAGVDTGTLAGRYASPSPWANRPGGDAVCANAAITVRFTPSVVQSSLTTNRVLVEQCGAGSATPAVKMGFEPGVNENLPLIIKTAALGVSPVSLPGSAAEGTGVLRLSKLAPTPNRAAGRCSSDLSMGCVTAAQCGVSGATCKVEAGDANVFVDDFAAKVAFPAGSEVRGRTYVATVKVHASQGSVPDETRRAGILIRKNNNDGTREEVRAISLPLTDAWQDVSARLTMSEKVGTAEVRVFLLSPDANTPKAESDFYTYSALFDNLLLSDIAGVDCAAVVPVNLETIPSNHGFCDGDYKTVCATNKECQDSVGGDCVKATDGFRLTPRNDGSTFAGSVCDAGDAAKIGKACTDNASCNSSGKTDGVCRDGVWYRVVLKSGVCDNNAAKACVTNADCGTGAAAICNGITAFSSNGAAMKENPGACGDGNAYCFLFRAINKTCAVGAVITTPNPWIAKTEGEAVPYTAVPIAANDACVNLNPAGMNWKWVSSDTLRAGIDGNTTPANMGQSCRTDADCPIAKNGEVHSCVDNHCTGMPWTATAVALDETVVVPKVEPVKITATVESSDRSKVVGPADLFIQFAEPVVTEAWPRCAAACLNAEIGAHFNIPMDVSSLVGADNIQLWRVNCGNGHVDNGEDCDDGNTASGDGCSVICKNEGSNFTLNCGNGILNDGEDCDDKNATNGDGCSDKCLSEAVGKGSWALQGLIGSAHLVPGNQAATDGSIIVSGVCGDGKLQNTTVVGVGGRLGEQCDDGNNNDGDGCSAACVFEGTSITGAVCGNSKLERGEECEKGTDGRFAPWCDAAKCVRLGTAAPVCGNGKVDAGEECEKSQLVGAAQLLCDARCLWTGTASYNPPVRLAGCGNGKVEVGESCDDGNAKSGDGCSASCLNEGSSTTTGPGCGNGKIDKGESCDSADPATTVGCDPNRCTHLGTKHAVCGNGIVETGESCDWKVMVNARPPGTDEALAEAQAKTVCKTVATVGSPEVCVNLGTDAPTCGNGRIDVGESCDDGNTNDDDSCSSRCLNKGTLPDKVTTSVRLSNNSNTEVVLDVSDPKQDNLLSPNSTYRAILMGDDAGLRSASRKPLAGLNFWRPNTEATRNSPPPGVLDTQQNSNAYSWTFTTGTELCTPDRVDVTPAETSLYLIGARSRLDVKAKSKPDSCSADGQVLNALMYGWTWGSNKTDVASIVPPQDRMPQCGDAVIERGEDCDDSNALSGDGCSSKCLNEGSNYARQCGNGKVDAGESCDDRNTISGDGCSSKCLVEGFVPGSWKLAGVSGVCGNGVREYIWNATTGLHGEECDDGNIINGDGCSLSCTKEGSRAPLCNTDNNRRLDTNPETGSGEACDPKAGSGLGCDPNRCIWTGTTSATCGNKRVEGGEDCDDGNTKSGDGCSEVCLHEGVSADWAVTISAENEIRVIVGANTQAGFRAVSRGVCGNNVIERYSLPGKGGVVGEECDDGNTNSNDGCSSRCLNEGTMRSSFADNAGGDPTQYVEAKGITVQMFCRRADQDFPETNRKVCATDRQCIPDPVNNVAYNGVPFVCDPFNPWATATIEAKINAAPPRQDRANGKAGTAQVTVFCGAKSDAECADAGQGNTGSIGVGADSCCYERPTPDENLVEPKISQGVCPNGVFAVGFNQVIDDASLAGNMLLARRVDSGTCPAGSVAVDALGHLQSSVRNSGFEQNTADGSFDGWTVITADGADGVVAPSTEPAANTGKWEARMTLARASEKAGGIRASTPIFVTPGTRYRATVWYQLIESNKKQDAAFIRVRGENGFLAQYAVPKNAEVGKWQTVYVSFIPPTKSNYTLELALDNEAVISWDDVSVEAIGSAQASAGSLLNRVVAWVKSMFAGDIVHADAGLWCVSTGVDATVEPQADGVSSLVRLAPKKVLDTSAQYKLIARGDSSLGDGVVDGITNYHGVAMNGETVHQWMFTTAEKLCTLDNVRLDLSCVRNGKCQNNLAISCSTDRDCGPATDLTAHCRGEAFSGEECAAFRKKDQTTGVRAAALSNAAGGQEIQPVDGYRWAWSFNTSAVDTVSISKNTINPSAPVQRLGGAAGGRTCSPRDDKALTCKEGHCGGSAYLPECRTDVECVSLAVCRNGRCGGSTSLSKCEADVDCASFAVGVCKSATDVAQEAKSGSKRGEGYVSAEAKIVEDTLNAGLTTNLGQTQVGTQRFINTLCENPWPSDTTRRCTNNPSQICTINETCGTGKCVAALPLSDPEDSVTSGPLGGDRPTNFSLWYCRDSSPNLLPAPIAVGLPEISTLSAAPSSSTIARALFRDGSVGGVGIAAVGSRAEILKEVILTLATTSGTSNDAIGIRILKNNARLSPMEWYESQGFAGKPTELKELVDGYQAIQDGRTIYIGGTNLSNEGSEPRVYSNIYVLAYSEGASETTKTVYREILKNFRLNINLTNARVCSVSIAKSCSEDTECVGAGVCLSDIDKLHRDIIRVNDLARMSAALESTKARTGTYPLISSGSYLRAMSVSAWPSWQSTLGSALGIALPSDPIKPGLGRCVGDASPCNANNRCAGDASKSCQKDADCVAPGLIAGSCFNQTNGVYSCPPGSHVYQYQSVGSQAYTLSANFEYTPNSYPPYPSLWGLNSANFDISYCRANNGITMLSNVLRCGDGAVGTDTSGTCTSNSDCHVLGSQCISGHCAEECEVGQVDHRACSLALASASTGQVTVAVVDGGKAPISATSSSLQGSVCVSDATKSCISKADCESTGYLGSNECISIAKLIAKNTSATRVCQNYATLDCSLDETLCIASKDMGPCISLAPLTTTSAKGTGVCGLNTQEGCNNDKDCTLGSGKCLLRTDLKAQVCNGNAENGCSTSFECLGNTGPCVEVLQAAVRTPSTTPTGSTTAAMTAAQRCQHNIMQDCSTRACSPADGPCVTIVPDANGQITGTQTRTCNNSCSYGSNGGWSTCGVAAFCGDNKIDSGEVCDNGSLNGTYGKCNTSCSGLSSYCGNGTLDAGEVCDNGSLNGTYGKCKDDCSGAFDRCGDGVVQKAEGEVCDRPGSSVPDSRGVCGGGSSAGRVNSACATDADCGGAAGTCNLCPASATYQQVKKGTCGSDCRSITWKTVSNTDSTLKCFAQGQCGNGVKEGTEACDDGNTDNTDGCIIDVSSGKMCILATCGDGYVNGKVCAGGTPGQEQKCELDTDCGANGRCVVKEECDQGAGNGQVCTPRSGASCTYCSNSCRRVTVSGDYCGDGKLNPASEECDKNLNPLVNAWEGLILKNSSNQETERYICIGTPGVNENAWNFSDVNQWQSVDSTHLTVNGAVEQENDGMLLNNVIEVVSMPIPYGAAPADPNLYSLQAPAVNGGATSRTFNVSLSVRCAKGVTGACGDVGVSFVPENTTPATGFPPGTTVRAEGSTWKTLNRVLMIPLGIQNNRLRIYVNQANTRFPLWIDRVSVTPASVTPAAPWYAANVGNQAAGALAIGSGSNNVAACNAQTCMRGCPAGGTVCENILHKVTLCLPAGQPNCTDTIVRSNDLDQDGIADACDTDRDGDGTLDVNDCNPADKDLNSDAGMLMSYSNRSWSFQVEPDVRAIHLFVANYNVNSDPQTLPLTSGISSKHDLRKMGDPAWLQQENARMLAELTGKNVCVSATGEYSSQICSAANPCAKPGELCKPWNDNPNLSSFGMKPRDAFFKLRVSLDGRAVADERGQVEPHPPAAPLGSPEEVVLPITPGTVVRTMKIEWLNDWCDRGTWYNNGTAQYGCTAAGDGIGHDLNLVIQRVLVDTETSAGRCEKLVAPDGSQFWPSGTNVAPVPVPVVVTGLPTGQSCIAAKSVEASPAYTAPTTPVCTPYMQGANQIGYIPCSPAGQCVSCATNPALCQQRVCNVDPQDTQKFCTSNADCPAGIACIVQGQTSNRQFTCDTSTGACVRI